MVAQAEHRNPDTRPRRRYLLGLVTGAVLLAPLAGTAPIASAQQDVPVTTVSCGQVLTTSVTVANDLTDCGGDGLVVGADGITVDLGGRTIDGVGLGSAVDVRSHRGVVVRNGTVREFDHGVLLGPGSASGTVSGLTVADNQEAGVLLAAAAGGHQVRGNTLVGNALAVALLDGTERAVVLDNIVGEGGGSGILVSHATDNRLERNTVSGGSDAGIVLEAASRNTVRDNVVEGVSDAAVLLEAESDGNVLVGNRLTASDGGIVVDTSTGNVLTLNTVHDMSDNGIDLEGAHNSVVLGNDVRFNGEGIALYDATGNWLQDNVADSSGGTAIILEGASTGNALVGNSAQDSGSGGISAITLGEPGLGNLISANAANRNQGNGIDVSGVGDVLTSNVANGNSAWGISAGGVVDGGGNRASGNAEAAQCSGVVCNGSEPPADTDAPSTVITDAPRHPSAVTTASFGFEAGDDEAVRFECSVDDAAFVPCTSPTTYTSLSLGWHTFAVRSVDAAGNVDATPASYSWSVEEAPPVDCGSTVTLIATADAWLDQNSSTTNKGDDSALKIRSKGPSDNFRTVVRFALPAKPDACVVESAQLSLYSAGGAPNRTLHALRIVAPWTESTVTWANQPATAGDPASTSAGDGWRHWAVKGQVQAMYDDGRIHGFLLRDATENSDAEQGFSTRESEEGPRLVLRFVPLIVDSSPPRTAITSGPDESTTETSATFGFAADEPGSTFTCTLDGADPEPCTSPTTYSGLAAGAHVFSVAATDRAGNIDPTPAVREWTVEDPSPPPDTTPPAVQISTGPEPETTATTAELTFTADDPDATFTCTLDGADPDPCTSPTGYTGLGVGVHTFTVTATDPAGNTSPPALWSWTVLAPPPPPVDCGPTLTLTASADAWLDQNSSGTNKGADSILNVRSKQPRDNMRSLVGFTVPGVPSGCVVESATLRLFAASSTAGRTIQAYRIASAWAESSVTWNSQPATAGTAATTTSGQGWREWAVGSQVQAMIDSGAPHGFLLRDAVESVDREQQFHAREKGENPPQLVVRLRAAG